MKTHFWQPKHGPETLGYVNLKNLKQKFEKPTTKDLLDLTEGKMSQEMAQQLLEQIEELCLITIEQYYANGQKI